MQKGLPGCLDSGRPGKETERSGLVVENLGEELLRTFRVRFIEKFVRRKEDFQ